MKELFTMTQISNMLHAIGGKPTRTPYRNYFNTRTVDEEWEDLVKKGYAKGFKTEFSGQNYSITDKGITLLLELN